MNVKLNQAVHAKLLEISNKRKADGHPISSMSAILAEYILRNHKREVKNGNK